MDHASDVTRDRAVASSVRPRILRTKQGGELRGLGASSPIWENYSTRPAGSRAASTGGSRWSSSLADRRGATRGSGAGSPTGASGACTTASTPSAIRRPRCSGDYMAAVLACGARRGAEPSRRGPSPAAAARRPAAARGHGPDARRAIAAGHRHPPREGRCTRSTSRTSTEIPITTVPRILLDLAPSLDARRSSRAPATRRGSTTRHDARAGSRRASRATPARRASRSCAPRSGPTPRSASSRIGFLALLREHGLPAPRTNVGQRRRQGRLPLAAARSHRRAAELPLPRHRARAFEADVARRRRSNHLAFTLGRRVRARRSRRSPSSSTAASEHSARCRAARRAGLPGPASAVVAPCLTRGLASGA